MSKLAHQQALQDQQYDPVKLAAMAEPLTIRVERIKGASRTPVNIPSPGGQGFNTGFTAEQLGGLETWIVNNAGGGMYRIQVWDSIQASLSWRCFFDPALHRELVPGDVTNINQPAQPQPQMMQPMMVMTAPPAQPQAQAVPQQVQPVQMPNGQTGFVSLPWPPPQPQPTVQPQQAGPAPMSIPYNPWPIPSYGTPLGGATDGEKQRLQAELAQAKADRQQEAYQRQLETQKAEHQRQLDELRRQIESSKSDPRLDKLEAAITAFMTKPAIDPQIAEMREENRRVREEAAQARRDQEMKDMFRMQQEATQRQLDLLAQQNKHDPIAEALKENARQQIDLFKDFSRTTQLITDKMAGQLMKPSEVMHLAQEAHNATDQQTKLLVGNFGTMLDMQQRAIQFSMEAQGQGDPPWLGAIREVAGGAKDYLTRLKMGEMKTQQAQIEAQARIADAHTESARAQQMQLIDQANREQAMAEQTQAHMAQVEQQRRLQIDAQRQAAQAALTTSATSAPAGLSGPSIQATATPTFGAAPTPAEVQHLVTGTAVPGVVGKLTKGKTDEEWFGLALPEVLRLRSGAQLFHNSVTATPPQIGKDGKVRGVEPNDAAIAIIRAADIVTQNKLNFPAFVLFKREEYANFLDILLPDLPQAYRDAVAQQLMHFMKNPGLVNAASLTNQGHSHAGPADDDDLADDDGDADEDDEDEDEQTDDASHDGKVHANGNGTQAMTTPGTRAAHLAIPRQVS